MQLNDHLDSRTSNLETMAPPTIVRYPIPGNESGGLLHIYGERTASNVVLYCGGWPDGVEPFTPMAMRLTTSSASNSKDGCFVGITCWPGFDAESFQQQLKFLSFKREGYNFRQVACCINEAAKQLFVEYYRRGNRATAAASAREQENPQFTVIFHDFGVLPGLIFVNRSIEEQNDDLGGHVIIPDRIVLLDVLLEPHGRFKSQHLDLSPYTTHELLVYLAYRGTFASAFAMLQYISEAIGLFTFRILYTFVILLGLAPLHPRGHDVSLLHERKMDQHHQVYTFYPYYHLFQALLFNKHDLMYGCLPLDLVKTPILYLYGEEKNVVSALAVDVFALLLIVVTTTTTLLTTSILSYYRTQKMFHDHRSLAILEQEEQDGTSDCRVVKVAGAGHWMYCQRPDVCELEIRKFMDTKCQ